MRGTKVGLLAGALGERQVILMSPELYRALGRQIVNDSYAIEKDL
jgi:hypothetical protein